MENWSKLERKNELDQHCMHFFWKIWDYYERNYEFNPMYYLVINMEYFFKENKINVIFRQYDEYRNTIPTRLEFSPTLYQHMSYLIESRKPEFFDYDIFSPISRTHFNKLWKLLSNGGKSLKLSEFFFEGKIAQKLIQSASGISDIYFISCTFYNFKNFKLNHMHSKISSIIFQSCDFKNNSLYLLLSELHRWANSNNSIQIRFENWSAELSEEFEKIFIRKNLNLELKKYQLSKSEWILQITSTYSSSYTSLHKLFSKSSSAKHSTHKPIKKS